MTQETKIGLLVALGVILLISILVSDHLSVAQQQQEAALTDLPRQGDSAAPVRSADAGSPRRAVEPEAPVPMPEELGGAETVSVDRDERTRSLPPVWRTTTRRTSPPTFDGESQLSEPLNEREPSVVSRRSPTGERLPVIGERSPTPAAPEQVVHYVDDGESLYDIAEEYYGDGNYWKRIHEANRDVIPKPSLLRPGVRLVIPNKAGHIEARSPAASTPPPASAEAYREYRVKSGESLSKLAARYFGSIDDWRKLYELNEDRLDDPDKLAVGDVIRVPAR